VPLFPVARGAYSVIALSAAFAPASGADSVTALSPDWAANTCASVSVSVTVYVPPCAYECVVASADVLAVFE
jgi:hypothetical protein